LDPPVLISESWYKALRHDLYRVGRLRERGQGGLFRGKLPLYSAIERWLVFLATSKATKRWFRCAQA
jgi:hypothetical protein